MIEPNGNTREGLEYWDRFCSIPRFSFWKGEDAVLRVPDSVGHWIDHITVSKLINEMQDHINELRNDVRILTRPNNGE